MHLPPNLSWKSLLAAVILAPLAVGVLPLSGVPLTLNVFVQAKVIVLAVTIAIALGAWALATMRADGLRIGRALAPLGALVAVAGVSTAFALSPRTALFGDFEQGVGFLALLLCVIAAFLVSQQVRSGARLRELTTAVSGTAVAVAAIGLSQQVLGFDPLGIGTLEWLLQRGFGTIGNPDTYAAYLVLPTLLAVHRLRHAAGSRPRMLWGAATVLLLSTELLAQTRAPIVGLLVGLSAYAVWEVRVARARATRAKKSARTQTTDGWFLLVVAVAAATIVAAGTAVSTLITGASSEVLARMTDVESLLQLGGRLPLWRSALDIARAHPILGVGPDNFRLAWYPVRDHAHIALGAGLVITDPHSLPLFALATIGIVGLVAGLAFLGSALVVGARTLIHAERSSDSTSDYPAWVFGSVALSVTLLASLLATIVLFLLFIAIGVLIAPSLRSHALSESGSRAVRAAGAGLSALLLIFAGLTAAAQLTAARVSAAEPGVAAARAASARALAPWDTKLRDLRFETMVNAALESVFTDRPDAVAQVGSAAAALARARQNEQREYLLPYREAVLLLGAGQKLGAEQTRRGIAAGLDALEIYPNSLELRTGIAAGYLSVDDPDAAIELLEGVWDADPRYVSAGLTYAEALAAQDRMVEAQAVLALLAERFPGEPAVPELQTRLSD